MLRSISIIKSIHNRNDLKLIECRIKIYHCFERKMAKKVDGSDVNFCNVDQGLFLKIV